MKHVGDITKLKGADLPLVDCVTGGSPCQDLSTAGKRTGLIGTRSGLFMEQIRIIKELRHASNLSQGNNIKPRYMVWENVMGAFSSNEGRDFATVLEETIKIVQNNPPALSVPKNGWTKSGCLYDELGRWSIAWRVHDSQFWGVPQRRKRIALVADFGGLSAPEILFVRKGLSWSPSKSGETESEITVRIGNSSKTADSAKQLVFDARGNGDGKTVCTITGDHQSRITDYTAICVQATALGGSDKYGPPGTGTNREVSYTLDTLRPHVVANPTIGVRRLTPLEYERLQGYPDNWTDIGDYINSKGYVMHTSDAKRYRALGNSIALPFWFWLSRRISAQYDQPATLGSLFDGIGGFPFCWELCNGRGTAVWASEVDEFCIAVTKYHFGEQ